MAITQVLETWRTCSQGWPYPWAFPFQGWPLPWVASEHATLQYLCPVSLPKDPILRAGNRGLTPGTSSDVAKGGMLLWWALPSEGDFFSLDLAILCLYSPSLP